MRPGSQVTSGSVGGVWAIYTSNVDASTRRPAPNRPMWTLSQIRFRVEFDDVDVVIESLQLVVDSF